MENNAHRLFATDIGPRINAQGVRATARKCADSGWDRPTKTRLATVVQEPASIYAMPLGQFMALCEAVGVEVQLIATAAVTDARGTPGRPRTSTLA